MTLVKNRESDWMPVNTASPLEVNPGAGIQVRVFGRYGENGGVEVRAEIWIEDLEDSVEDRQE